MFIVIFVTDFVVGVDVVVMFVVFVQCCYQLSSSSLFFVVLAVSVVSSTDLLRHFLSRE